MVEIHLRSNREQDEIGMGFRKSVLFEAMGNYM
jgi:hypothetical protein